MISDQFGNPIRGGSTRWLTSETEKWLEREGRKMANEWEVERRLRELRNSLSLVDQCDGSLVGQTVTVRLPKRYRTAE